MRYLFSVFILTLFFSSCTAQEKGKSEPAVGAEVSESLFINEDTIISTDAEIHSNSFLQPDITGTIGVIVLKRWNMEQTPSAPTKMQFLNDDDTEWLTFSFDGGDNYEEEYRKFMSKSEQGLDPRMIHFEYQILAMDCVADEDNYYRVIVDKHSRETKRLKRQEGLAFETWAQHILTTLIGLDETKLRDGIDGEKVVLSNGDGIYTGMEAEGDWLKVSTVVYDDETPKETAWIKWREKDRLLIDLHYMF